MRHSIAHVSSVLNMSMVLHMCLLFLFYSTPNHVSLIINKVGLLVPQSPVAEFEFWKDYLTFDAYFLGFPLRKTF